MWTSTKRFSFDKRTGVHRRTNLRAGDENAHKSTLGVAIVGMEQSGRDKVVNSGLGVGRIRKSSKELRVRPLLRRPADCSVERPRLSSVTNSH
ncbi:Uncharacterized protein DBV15_08571 [Temnothorax longispinosus]|uniref:Uncharacterized protein n=1 Tax=Temnothorax longispinosus TaxID=300112 RepID=A0A4S2L4C9_9HYME|nr:Uncharacterized protein DBV15_08571 [Temnothorax longispinosus]